MDAKSSDAPLPTDISARERAAVHHRVQIPAAGTPPPHGAAAAFSAISISYCSAFSQAASTSFLVSAIEGIQPAPC
ncbi:hypothetical protein [Paenibacillus sp. FSL H8-0034]|uniref:hypothetical protein n=1 Tax=Paenibacillus sp. FSL H8-0034 TaxID=2954671 RepID=UPI0030FAE3F7